MIYICSKQGKIDRLWGVFIKHLLQMQEAGIEVEYVKKGEVVLNGNGMSLSTLKTPCDMSLSVGSIRKEYVVLIGYDIQPLIDYLEKEQLDLMSGWDF